MEKAVVIGTFEFLGFHFCTSLLEEGYEVEGVHFDFSENEFLEEKRMEIGRNANFQEKLYRKWLSQSEISDQTLIVIDYYDIYLNNMNFDSDSMEKFLEENADKVKDTGSKIVFLLPVQWHSATSEPITRILQNKIASHFIYLPTIYGPWQSSSFLFQQAMLKGFNDERKISIGKQEWVFDSLYADDIVEAILMIAERESAASYIIRSNIPDHWLKCAEYLSIPSEEYTDFRKDTTLETGKTNIKKIDSHIPYSEGLEKQRRHLKRLLDGRS